MPFRRAIREGVIKVGQGEATATGDAKINRVAQGGGYGSQESFRAMRDEPTENLEQKSEHARGIWL